MEGSEVLRDKNGNRLGEYDPHTNRTTAQNMGALSVVEISSPLC
jgi:hypothetical protein